MHRAPLNETGNQRDGSSRPLTVGHRALILSWKLCRTVRVPRIKKQPLPVGVRAPYEIKHDDELRQFSWSPDGSRIAAPTPAGSMVWEAHNGSLWRRLKLRGSAIIFAPDGTRVLSVSVSLAVWDLDSGQRLWSSKSIGARSLTAAWSKQDLIAVGCGMEVWILDADSGVIKARSPVMAQVTHVAWSPDGAKIAWSSHNEVCIGALHRNRIDISAERSLRSPSAALTWSPDGQTIAIAHGRSVQFWDKDLDTRRLSLEGHTGTVFGVDYSADGQLLASSSDDSTVRLWRSDTGEFLGSIPNTVEDSTRRIAAVFHPILKQLATAADQRRTICIWQLDRVGRAPSTIEPRYATAKIALVGDGSVGKTTLGHKLTTGEFKVFPRTHGQQFWPYAAISTRRNDGTECEAILWDLAGQADYRLTHALFIDDADVALILFNASDRHQPMKGVEYWLNALRHRRGRSCQTILVGAQIDTGDLSMTRTEIDEFCRDQGITGGYVGVSAMTGAGIAELVDRLRSQLRWNEMTPTVTTNTFTQIKRVILQLKSEQVSASSPLRPDDLRKLLHQRDSAAEFSDDEMMTAAGHLEDHGYVSILRSSDGEQRILLAADLLASLTASIVLEARRNPRGLGALSENELLSGSLELPELAGLPHEDRHVLADAAASLFIEHNLCFREKLGPDTLLVFPSLIHQVKPGGQMANIVEDVSFDITGATSRLYATLVVLLGYTNTFTRTNQWQHQAQYETGPGEVCGFRQLAEREGHISLGLYYGATTSEHTRRLFEGLFETFLRARDISIMKFPVIVCACNYRQNAVEVARRIRSEKPSMACAECGEKLPLPRVGELDLQPFELSVVVSERATAARRTDYEKVLSAVKGLVRDRANSVGRVRCFVSYAWGDRDHERWVAAFVDDLLRADIDVVFDQKDNAAIGQDIARFLSEGISRADYIVVVGTPLYMAKYENRVSAAGSIVAAEVDLIHQRLMGSEQRKSTVLPLVRAGDRSTSLPPLLQGRTCADFAVDESYFVSLLDVILTLYTIPVGDSAVAELRRSLRDHEVV